MKQRSFCALAASLCLAAATTTVGCGGPDLGAASTVTGKVTVDGAPLGGALVMFHAMGGLPADYRTQQTTTGGDGAYALPKIYPGEYEVIVADPSVAAGADAAADPGMQSAAPGEELMPAAAEELRVRVGGDMTYDIQLTKSKRS